MDAGRQAVVGGEAGEEVVEHGALGVVERGELGGRYAYPFIDVATIGWARTGLNTLVISAGFLAVAFALVRLDTRLAPAGRDAEAEDEVAV